MASGVIAQLAATHKQSLEPTGESLAESTVDVQILRLDCQSHLPGILPGRQPSVNLRPEYLALSKLPLRTRNSFDVALGHWPNRIVAWNHFGHEVLEFPGRRIVRHQPDSDAGRTVDDGACRVGMSRGIDTLAPESVCYGFPTTTYVVVGVHHDAKRLPPGSFDFIANGSQQRIDPLFVRDGKRQIRSVDALPEMSYDVLVVLAFHEE